MTDDGDNQDDHGDHNDDNHDCDGMASQQSSPCFSRKEISGRPVNKTNA